MDPGIDLLSIRRLMSRMEVCIYIALVIQTLPHHNIMYIPHPFLVFMYCNSVLMRSHVCSGSS